MSAEERVVAAPNPPFLGSPDPFKQFRMARLGRVLAVAQRLLHAVPRSIWVATFSTAS
jgi:hypothetical protein